MNVISANTVELQEKIFHTVNRFPFNLSATYLKSEGFWIITFVTVLGHKVTYQYRAYEGSCFLEYYSLDGNTRYDIAGCISEDFMIPGFKQQLDDLATKAIRKVNSEDDIIAQSRLAIIKEAEHEKNRMQQDIVYFKREAEGWKAIAILTIILMVCQFLIFYFDVL